MDIFIEQTIDSNIAKIAESCERIADALEIIAEQGTSREQSDGYGH